MLIMDQKVTTQPILDEIDERGVKFATLRPGPGPARRLPAPPARQLRPRRSRHHPAPLPGHPGEIITDRVGITVKINRRAYSPVLRHASLPADTAVPWWGQAPAPLRIRLTQGPKYRRGNPR
jgi:hypothetical protein